MPFLMLSSSTDGHSCIINCVRLLSCGLFVMPCHGKIHCTSFNYGNLIIHCKNALVTVTVDLGRGWTQKLFFMPACLRFTVYTL